MAQNISTTSLKPWRIFMGFHDIAMYQSQLKKGFEALGCHVTRIAFSDDLKFGEDDSGRVVLFRWLKQAMEWNRAAWRRLDRTPKTRLLEVIRVVWWLRVSAMWKRTLQWAALLWTVALHDVIVLSYGGSFVEPSDHTMEPATRKFRDLRLIKQTGRKLIFTFHGSDSRPPYLDGYVLRNPRRLSTEQLIELTKSRRRLLEGIERFADYLVSVPTQCYFHSRPVVLHEYLGRPFDVDQPLPTSEGVRSEKEKLVVLHAPSSTHAKGTDELREIIARLQGKGWRLEYVEIVRRPHAELVQALTRADLVVDQVFSDRFITGVATEAMYFGKPVVLAGYYAEYYRQDYGGRLPLPPIVFCHPQQLESELEVLIKDASRREALGKEGAAYVRTHFAPQTVAERWLEMIEGKLPASAFYDSSKLRYPLGCALPRREVINAVKSVLAVGGREALCLQDKPELEAAVLALAE